MRLPSVALEVGLDRALAAVGGVEIGGAEMAAVLGLDEGRAPGAGVVAGLAALDLDHVGAEIGQDLSGPRPGQDAGELQHTQTSQRTRHDDSFAAINPTGQGTSGVPARFCPEHGDVPLNSRQYFQHFR